MPFMLFELLLQLVLIIKQGILFVTKLGETFQNRLPFFKLNFSRQNPLNNRQTTPLSTDNQTNNYVYLSS